MRKEIIGYIKTRPDFIAYLRKHPDWYRKLGRDPSAITIFEVQAIHYHEKTIPQQVARFTNGAQMASMMLGMFQAFHSK